MVNLTMVVADGAGRWETTTHGYRHDPRLYTFSARTLARSLPFPRLGSPLISSFAARFCSSYILGAFGVWRFFFFFPQRRMDSTVQAFSSHPPNFYFFSISRI